MDSRWKRTTCFAIIGQGFGGFLAFGFTDFLIFPYFSPLYWQGGLIEANRKPDGSDWSNFNVEFGSILEISPQVGFPQCLTKQSGNPHGFQVKKNNVFNKYWAIFYGFLSFVFIDFIFLD